MKEIIKLSLILFIVAGIASGLLAVYNGMTKPIITQNAETKKNEAKSYVHTLTNKELASDASSFKFETVTLEDGSEYYKAYKDDEFIGYSFVAEGAGYSGVVRTMVGTDKDFNITTIKVIKQTETPGLGANAQVVKYQQERPYFEQRFNGKSALEVVVDKDDKNSPNKIESLTGSTITTRTVCNSIQKYAKKVQASAEKGGM